MPENLYGRAVKIWRIELMRCNFNWIGGKEDEDKEHLNEYKATLRYFVPTKPSATRSAFVNLILNRKGHEDDNFEFSARYYFSVGLGEPDDDKHETLLKDITTKLVWSRFYDVAKSLLTQAGIEGVEIPILPDTVVSEQIKPVTG